MDAHTLVNLALRCRTLQKLYARKREQGTLLAAKDAERRLDLALKHYYHGQPLPLFEDDDESTSTGS